MELTELNVMLYEDSAFCAVSLRGAVATHYQHLW